MEAGKPIPVPLAHNASFKDKIICSLKLRNPIHYLDSGKKNQTTNPTLNTLQNLST